MSYLQPILYHSPLLPNKLIDAFGPHSFSSTTQILETAKTLEEKGYRVTEICLFHGKNYAINLNLFKEVLATCRFLQTVSFSHCFVKNEQLEEICCYIREGNHRITKICLEGNPHINRWSLEVLAQLDSLKKLDVRTCCHLQESDIQAFSQCRADVEVLSGGWLGYDG